MLYEQNKEKLDSLLNKYKLSETEKNDFLGIITPIYKHEEFQRRMTDEFSHHGSITLGEHILEDSIVTYLLSKKEKSVNTSLVVKISMMHDLYTLPWQIKNYSLSKSIYKEGRIMAKADKKVSRGQITNMSTLTSLITGHNKSIKKRKK